MDTEVSRLLNGSVKAVHTIWEWPAALFNITNPPTSGVYQQLHSTYSVPRHGGDVENVSWNITRARSRTYLQGVGPDLVGF